MNDSELHFPNTNHFGLVPSLGNACNALCRQSKVFTPDKLATLSVHRLWIEVYKVTTGGAKACPAGEQIRNS